MATRSLWKEKTTGFEGVFLPGHQLHARKLCENSARGCQTVVVLLLLGFVCRNWWLQPFKQVNSVAVFIVPPFHSPETPLKRFMFLSWIIVIVCRCAFAFVFVACQVGQACCWFGALPQWPLHIWSRMQIFIADLRCTEASCTVQKLRSRHKLVWLDQSSIYWINMSTWYQSIMINHDQRCINLDKDSGREWWRSKLSGRGSLSQSHQPELCLCTREEGQR